MEKRINGKAIAKVVLKRLKPRVKKLKKKGKLPHLAIFSADDDSASASYIQAKKKAAKKLGVKLTHLKFKKETSYQDFAEQLNMVGKNPRFSGIIIQKPLPVSLSHASLDLVIPVKKDVDGSHPKTIFFPPVAMAVLRTLDFIRTSGEVRKRFPSRYLFRWLTNYSILLIGRGETAGKPLAQTFSGQKIKFLIAHQDTEDLARFVKRSNIVISCVGKEIIKKEMIKPGAILIGVGIRINKEGKFKGDFDEKEIEEAVSFYTPTPGGIGPLTVASLMENLVRATEKS